MTRVPDPIRTFVMPSIISKNYHEIVNRGVHRRLQTLMETRDDPIEKQRQRQVSLLNELLAHAVKNVPHYREKYSDAPTEIDTLEDLTELPPLEKDELKQNAGRLVSETHDTDTLHQEFTSGSTGKPLSIYVDDDAAAWQQAHQLRHYREMGYEPGDKIAVIWGEGQYFRMKEFKDTVDNLFRNKRELRTFELSPEEVREYSRFLDKYDPDIIESYPSAVVLLCEAIEDQGLSVSPKAVQTTSEMLSEREREYIESVMGAPVYNKFGASEVGPVALSCKHDDAMHINTESIIVETDDEGQLYVTNIRNYAMPIIRYEIGDVVELEESSPDPCDCGSRLPRIKAIRGKMNDLVVTTNGTYLDPYFFVDMMDRGPAVETFKVIQHDDQSLEVLVIPEAGGDTEEIKQHVSAELSAVDEQLPVTVNIVKEVPETEGWKRRYVLSEMDDEIADL